jgi:hypothetical protein
MSTKRPLVFVDLDDTLFQTARKMPEGVARAVATLDVNGQPNGYMTPVQQALVDWLLGSADVVPVTARSVEAYSRVRLPFSLGAICSHGGTMLGGQRQLDSDWHGVMADALAPFQERLHTERDHPGDRRVAWLLPAGLGGGGERPAPLRGDQAQRGR